MDKGILMAETRWKDDTNLRQIKVVVCTETYTFEGDTYYTYGQRLSDVLNEGFTVDDSVFGKYFLPLTNVSVFPPKGVEETAASTYIRKSSILFVGEKVRKPPDPTATPFIYPVREKAAVDVKIRFPTYTLVGKAHNDLWEVLVDTLEKEEKFLPLTKVEIIPKAANETSKFDFVAINKDQIMYVAHL